MLPDAAWRGRAGLRRIVAALGADAVKIVGGAVRDTLLGLPVTDIDLATPLLPQEVTRRLEAARWGLVPAWAKGPSIGSRAFNARAEEVEDKPMFRQALIKRRAVIPASGYYEWHTEDGVKTPYYIHPADDSPLLFAGLYEWWKDASKPDDDPHRWLLSFTIMTRGSTGALGSVHDRMPLFVDADYADVWLDPTTDNVGDLLDATIDAAPALVDGLAMREVGPAVGNVRNNGPELIAPAR